LDVYTQAITPSRHAAQDAVMALVLSARDSKQQPKVGTSGALEIDGKKGTKGTQIYAFFAPSLFSA
jgi:hypothetical protein